MNYKDIVISVITIFFSLGTSVNTFSQNSYKIEVNAPFAEGSTAYLANYDGENSYIVDSLIASQSGKLTFFGKDQPLPTGQYLLFIKPNIQIDLLIDKEQDNIKIDLKESFTQSKITGSSDTQLFWEYLNGLEIINSKISEQTTNMHKASENGEDMEKHIATYKKLLEESVAYSDKHISENKGTWFAAFIKSTKNILPPHAAPANNEETKENVAFVKKHFFDYIDFTDERLWRTNSLTPRIDSYLQEWIVQHPDTIAKEASWLVSKTMENEYCFSKMLSHLNNQAAMSLAMGMENVWAKLAEDYIFDKDLNWIDSAQYSNLKKDYSLIEFNRVGMTGKNLKLMTLDGDSINTNEVEANYLMLYFYAPSCAYCRAEMPKLRNDLYPKYKEKGLKIIAINLDRDVDAWKEYIEMYDMNEWTNVFDPNFQSEYWLKYNTSGTPSLYLLDKDKTIIAKRLDIENLDKYLEMISR